MGRNKIQINEIRDQKVKQVTFKKRRLGVLRKAMQLSKLTGARVQLKIYFEGDQSFVEYHSKNDTGLDNMQMDDACVDEYAKFNNQHYEFVAQIDDRSTCPSTGEASDRIWWAQVRKNAETL